MAENATNERTQPENDEDPSLEVYLWAGGVLAGLGLLFTPAVTGVPVLYCALQLREQRPLSAIGIGIVFSVTVIFWSGFLFGREVMTAIVQVPIMIALSAVGLLVIGSVVLAVFYLFALAGGNQPLEDD
jgi:hypothetical protein